MYSPSVCATWIDPGPIDNGSPQLIELEVVGGECGDHGGHAADGAQPEKRKLQGGT